MLGTSLFSQLKNILAAGALLWCFALPLTAAPQSNSGILSSRRVLQEPNPPLPRKQQDDVPPKSDLITLQLIDEELAKVDQAELDEDEKATIQKHYLAARQFLTQAGAHVADAANYREVAQSATVVETRKDLRAQIDEIENENLADEPLPRSFEALSKWKVSLEAETESLRKDQKFALDERARRSARSQEFLNLTNDAQNRLAYIMVQLATEAPESDNPLLTRARLVELRAEKQKHEQALELYRVERDAYEATAGTLSIQQTLATKKFERSNSRLKRVVDAIGRLNEREIETILREVINVRDELKSEDRSHPLLPLAEQNVTLAEQLDDDTAELQEAKTLRSDGQAAVQKVEAELKTMQTRVKHIGLSDEVGVMLRRDKNKLMSHDSKFLKTEVAKKIETAHIRKYRSQDWRAELSDMPAAIAREFGDAKIPPALHDSLTPKATEILQSRRRILEKLEDTEVDLLHDLLEIQSLQSEHTNKSREFADFLDERILWVRSEPTLGGAEDWEGIQSATRWFLTRENWNSVGSAITRGAEKHLPSVALIALGLLGLVLLQPRSRKEIRRLGAIAAKRGCRDFSPTVSSFLHTSVLAFFWPAIGLAIGWLITTQNASQFSWAIGRALTVVSAVAITLEMLRCVCRKEGLAQNHFAWTEGFRNTIRKHTGWFMVIGLPLLFLLIAIESSNNNEYSRLGRVTMLFLLAVSMVYTLRVFAVFRPGGASYDPNVTGFDASVNRIRSLTFAAAMVGFLLLFLFSVLGYYESVYKIGTSLLQTILLLAWAIIVFALAMRFFLVRRRKLRFEQLIQQRKAAIAAAEKQAESGISIATEALDIDLQNESGMDITDVSRQARELTGVIFLIAIGLTLLGIWQYLLPATKILDSWELWRITVGSAVESVTARDLLLSLIAFSITFFSVRNIPGMLELLLLQRLPLDAGARYAVASILRYILLVVGVIFALGFLKIPWSNYSWLVAAISVGLGFGLQEIVANFVSGLILLLERPVRVGDVVTIDGVTGIVSRIQMRATTVTNWDNQELVVPNKDLISGKLLNWTLSSVINRISLKVGVAYGTDVGKVRELISKIVERHPDVLQDPPPIITFEEFGDSSLNFVIRCCTTSIKRRWHLMDEINSAINEAFERENIEIPFPQRVVKMIDSTSDDSEAR